MYGILFQLSVVWLFDSQKRWLHCGMKKNLCVRKKKSNFANTKPI